jgi:hypothetical protein
VQDPIEDFKNPVAPMASASTSFVRNSEFDSFLFAPIGEERNGMALSVLSALARLDVDPWHEAASLRRSSPHAATERLTSLLSSLPNAQPLPPAAATIARLIGLLPRTARDDVGSGKTLTGKANHSWPIILYFIVAFVTMCSEQILARRDVKVPTGDGFAPMARHVDRATPKITGE